VLCDGTRRGEVLRRAAVERQAVKGDCCVCLVCRVLSFAWLAGGLTSLRVCGVW
jgi:hypothetical protein